MLRLYQAGGGSSEVDMRDQAHPDRWRRVREMAVRFLGARGLGEAADLLVNVPFDLYEGTNFFGDDFLVLHADVPLAQYLTLSEMVDDQGARRRFRDIAAALDELDHSVRFITASMSEDAEPAVVPAPTPTSSSDALERAMAEVERALSRGEPAAGIDRIHTALHAHLRAVAEAAGLTPGSDAGVVDVFRLLRSSHPAFQEAGPRAGDVARVLNAMATVVDALNPLRNRASLAHVPEDSLLADAEAMLVINAVRTMLHYVEKKTARS
jgi:hypothetical protein